MPWRTVSVSIIKLVSGRSPKTDKVIMTASEKSLDSLLQFWQFCILSFDYIYQTWRARSCSRPVWQLRRVSQVLRILVSCVIILLLTIPRLHIPKICSIHLKSYLFLRCNRPVIPIVRGALITVLFFVRSADPSNCFSRLIPRGITCIVDVLEIWCSVSWGGRILALVIHHFQTIGHLIDLWLLGIYLLVSGKLKRNDFVTRIFIRNIKIC